jgi:two-component system response regulator GlrR
MRILVVDDELIVLELLAEVLAAEGHTVDMAVSARAALEILERQPVELVISDVRMPEMDGLGLHREIEQRFPALGRLFIWMTGGSPDPDMMTRVKATALPILNKPFDLREVVRVVDAMKGGGR